MNSKRQGETWSRGTNSRLPFDVKVMFNLSIASILFTRDLRAFARKKITRQPNP